MTVIRDLIRPLPREVWRSLLRRGGGRAPMSFTSAATGNWNSPTTWGVSDYPRLVGDTVTIGAHNVTIQSTTTGKCGAITLNAGSTLTINGTFDMNGAMTIAGATTLTGTSGTWNLHGNNITSSASGSTYSWGGPSRAAMFTVNGAGGKFIHSGANVLTCNISFCSFNGVADSTLGRSNTNAIVQKFTNNDWISCGGLELDQTSTSINAGFQFNNNNIRSCRADMASFGLPQITMANQAIGTGAREIKSNTYDVGSLPTSPAELRLVNVVTSGVTVTGNIFGRVRMNATGASDGFATSGNLWFNTGNSSDNDGVWAKINSNVKLMTGEYIYYEGGQHGFADNGNSTAATFSNLILEQGLSTGFGTNWFMNQPDGVTISNILGIGNGFGNLIVWTVSKTYTTGPVIKNVTTFGSNGASGGPSDQFPLLLSFEQSGKDAASLIQCYNNIVYDATIGSGDYVGQNATAAAVTVNTFDHTNCYPNAAAYYQGSSLTATNTLGSGDLNVDPIFADSTRKMSTWDGSLGGAGTSANALTELLKLNGYGGTYNASYSIGALISYVNAGFQPTGAGATALNGTGRSAGNFGYR